MKELPEILDEMVDPPATNTEILTKDRLWEITSAMTFEPLEAEHEDPVPGKYQNYEVFHTSGTTAGEPTPIPYHRECIETMVETETKALTIMGLEESDVLLNLGAPRPHLSAWAIKKGAEGCGVEVVNQSCMDLINSLEECGIRESEAYGELKKASDRITSVAGLPAVVESVGKRIQQKEGRELQDLFPNLEKGFFGGDLVTEVFRTRIKHLWGMSQTREMYASCETDILACARDESRRLIPLDAHLFEIIPDGEDDRIVDIRDLEERTTGELLVTSPYRKFTRFERYRIGDNVEVVPASPRPLITVLGRTSTSVNLRGVILHEQSLHEAVTQAYRGSGPPDWRAEKIQHPDDSIEFRMYVPIDDIDVSAFDDTLRRINPTIEDAKQLDILSEIQLKPLSTFDGHEHDGTKTRRIVVENAE